MKQASATRLIASALAALLLAGCATSSRHAQAPDAAPYDPFEPVNRSIYAFNDTFDRNVFKPVAQGYDAVVPAPVDRGISNFFNNLGDVLVLVNSALQLKPHATGITAQRLLLNTTFGVFGLMDVATGAGKEEQNEDFGQTLGYWGLGQGPYLVLPILGPSSVRDGTGLLVDRQYAPLAQIDDTQARIGVYVLSAVDTRAGLLSAGNVLDTAAVDPYSYRRNVYLRRRQRLVHDGHPPAQAAPERTDGEAFDPFSDEDDDLFDERGPDSRANDTRDAD